MIDALILQRGAPIFYRAHADCFFSRHAVSVRVSLRHWGRKHETQKNRVPARGPQREEGLEMTPATPSRPNSVILRFWSGSLYPELENLRIHSKFPSGGIIRRPHISLPTTTRYQKTIWKWSGLSNSWSGTMVYWSVELNWSFRWLR